MRHYIDIKNNKYGRLTVLERSEPIIKNTEVRWICKCECGNVVAIPGSRLRSGETKSCGCLQKELQSQRAKITTVKHGGYKTRLYRIWTCMKNRCLCKNNTHYNYYGGRGITFCDEWSDFSVFKEWAINNGYSDELTLDRVDTNGKYEPSNCRWVTRREQAQNRRSTHLVTYNGKTQSISEWEKEIGIKSATIRHRLYKAHWSIEKALTTPVKEYKKRGE